MAPLNYTPSRVATVYCAGTQYDSKSNDVIAWLNQNTTKAQGETFFFPGPGSGEYADTLITAAASRTIERSKLTSSTPVGLPARVLKAHLDLQTGAATKMDAMTGFSVRANIDRALDLLRASATDGMVINMAGWSRGAVTCVGLAYRLADDPKLSRCPVNLFLFDPVPGPRSANIWNWTKELRQLRSNVASLGVVLMENEGRSFMMQPLVAPFVCSVSSCGEVSKDSISLYPMPGAHSSGVQSSGYFTEAADIGGHLVSEFLIRNGTPVARGKLLPTLTLVESYARLKHKALEKIFGAMTDRSRIIPNAQRGSLFFVNEHHREQFARAFPRLAMILDPQMNVPSWGSGSLAEVPMLLANARTMAQVVGDGVAVLLAQCAVPGTQSDRPDLEALLKALAYTGRIRMSFAPPKMSMRVPPISMGAATRSTQPVVSRR